MLLFAILHEQLAFLGAERGRKGSDIKYDVRCCLLEDLPDASGLMCFGLGAELAWRFALGTYEVPLVC